MQSHPMLLSSFTILSLLSLPKNIHAFSLLTPRPPQTTTTTTTTTALFMGAFNKRNKQADLLKKMELAKQQKQKEGGGTVQKKEEEDDSKQFSKDEIKKRNDMRRFEDLLNSESATLSHMNEYSEGRYLTKEQEEEEVMAGYSGIDRMYEGDPAPVACFEDLINPKTENALGKSGAERLLPWISNKNDPTDFVVVVTDPRAKSHELRQTVKQLQTTLSKDVLDKVMVINADTPPENRRWAKKDGITSIKMFSDEKREWMREYTALGKKRWSICMFLLSNGKVQKLVRDLDFEVAATVLSNAVKSLDREKLY